MKKIAIAALAALALATTACTTIVPVHSDAGASTNAKVGEASGNFLFGYLPLTSADISIATAAKNGGVTRIATVDSKTYSLLGIWVVRTTIVTGE